MNSHFLLTFLAYSRKSIVFCVSFLSMPMCKMLYFWFYTLAQCSGGVRYILFETLCDAYKCINIQTKEGHYYRIQIHKSSHTRIFRSSTYKIVYENMEKSTTMMWHSFYWVSPFGLWHFPFGFFSTHLFFLILNSISIYLFISRPLKFNCLVLVGLFSVCMFVFEVYYTGYIYIHLLCIE